MELAQGGKGCEKTTQTKSPGLKFSWQTHKHLRLVNLSFPMFRMKVF